MGSCSAWVENTHKSSSEEERRRAVGQFADTAHKTT